MAEQLNDLLASAEEMFPGGASELDHLSELVTPERQDKVHRMLLVAQEELQREIDAREEVPGKLAMVGKVALFAGSLRGDQYRQGLQLVSLVRRIHQLVADPRNIDLTKGADELEGFVKLVCSLDDQQVRRAVPLVRGVAAMALPPESATDTLKGVLQTAITSWDAIEEALEEAPQEVYVTPEGELQKLRPQALALVQRAEATPRDRATDLAYARFVQSVIRSLLQGDGVRSQEQQKTIAGLDVCATPTETMLCHVVIKDQETVVGEFSARRSPDYLMLTPVDWAEDNLFGVIVIRLWDASQLDVMTIISKTGCNTIAHLELYDQLQIRRNFVPRRCSSYEQALWLTDSYAEKAKIDREAVERAIQESAEEIPSEHTPQAPPAKSGFWKRKLAMNEAAIAAEDRLHEVYEAHQNGAIHLYKRKDVERLMQQIVSSIQPPLVSFIVGPAKDRGRLLVGIRLAAQEGIEDIRWFYVDRIGKTGEILFVPSSWGGQNLKNIFSVSSLTPTREEARASHQAAREARISW